MSGVPDKQRITLQLDAHRVALAIPREDEHYYRAAANALNERYKFYLKQVKNASAEDLWVYVALETMVGIQKDAFNKALEPIQKRIQDLNQQINETLEEINQIK